MFVICKTMISTDVNKCNWYTLLILIDLITTKMFKRYSSTFFNINYVLYGLRSKFIGSASLCTYGLAQHWHRSCPWNLCDCRVGVRYKELGLGNLKVCNVKDHLIVARGYTERVLLDDFKDPIRNVCCPFLFNDLVKPQPGSHVARTACPGTVNILKATII